MSRLLLCGLLSWLALGSANRVQADDAEDKAVAFVNCTFREVLSVLIIAILLYRSISVGIQRRACATRILSVPPMLSVAHVVHS